MTSRAALLRSLFDEIPVDSAPGRDALLHAVFALGAALVGDDEAVLEHDAHAQSNDVRVDALLQMYATARRSIRLDDALRRAAVNQTRAEALAAMEQNDTRIVTWLANRSRYIRTTPLVQAPEGVRPAIDVLIAGMNQNPAVAPGAIDQIGALHDVYDYEVVVAIEHAGRVAVAAGDRELMRGVVAAALRAVDGVRIGGHKLRAYGALLPAAVRAGDPRRVHDIVRSLVHVIATGNATVRDQVAPLRAAFAALVDAGEKEILHALFAELEPVVHMSPAPSLLALVASQRERIDDVVAAETSMSQAVDRARTLMPVDQFEATAFIVNELALWQIDRRAAWLHVICARLPELTDTFTTKIFYPTHQVIAAEHIVHAATHDAS